MPYPYAKRVHNFSAGPGTLPLEVVEAAREELPLYAGTGASVMEISHRSPRLHSGRGFGAGSATEATWPGRRVAYSLPAGGCLHAVSSGAAELPAI